MIKINLLTSKLKSQVNPQMTTIALNQDLVITRSELQNKALLRIFTLLFFPFSFYVFDNFYYQDEMKSQFPPLQKQIDDLILFNKAKEKFVNDIKQFEKEGEIIREKIKKINFLNSIRGHEIEIHKFFQKSLPEKLWIDEYAYNYEPSKTEASVKGEIRIKGLSVNASDVQKLRTEIKQNILFNSCEIVEQKTVDFEGQKLESFEMIISMGK